MPGPTTTDATVRDLVALALQGLERMELPSGLFCLERRRGDTEPHGRSLRYSLMVLIGLVRAELAGYEHGFDLERLRRALLERLDDGELKAGDYGLFLWANAVTGGERADELAGRLEASLSRSGGLAGREGMEVAWIVQGLALASERGDAASAAGVLQEALELLTRRNRSESSLFYHHGADGLRRRFPNFATQIYGVLALATAARLDIRPDALDVAARAAERLVALQLTDGGWPWLFDAETGRVVERYEVYSVHQHAMAPMGLLALHEAGGGRELVDAAVHGLGWIHGRNELGADMVDREDGLIYRSIRRRRPLDRAALVGSTASSLILRHPLPLGRIGIELNATCRPYELGWLLEGWCGREALAGQSGSGAGG
jgi:hypothetical protein